MSMVRGAKMPGVEVAKCPGVSIRWTGVSRVLSFIPDRAWRKARGDEHFYANDEYTIEGDLAERTLVSVIAITRKSGPAGLSAWLKGVWSDTPTDVATGAYKADAGGWYRSAGRMVQRAL